MADCLATRGVGASGFRGGIWAGAIPLAAILSVGVAFVVTRRAKRRLLDWAVAQALVLAVVSGSVGIAGLVFDASFDGQAYHQEAVLQMLDGWNPIRDPGGAYESSNLYAPYSNELWIEHYPKGAWLESAAIVAATGRIESGKAPNLILLIASFMVVFAAMLLTLPSRRWLALLFAAVLALNPVAVTQLFTFYIDGQMGSLVLLELTRFR